jgi:hypothetical protein
LGFALQRVFTLSAKRAPWTSLCIRVLIEEIEERCADGFHSSIADTLVKAECPSVTLGGDVSVVVAGTEAQEKPWHNAPDRVGVISRWLKRRTPLHNAVVVAGRGTHDASCVNGVGPWFFTSPSSNGHPAEILTHLSAARAQWLGDIIVSQVSSYTAESPRHREQLPQ